MKVGILGGGQLARMLALAGHPLGLDFVVLDPAEDACAKAVAQHIKGAYDDEEKLRQFAESCDVVTYEFENVPAESVRFLTGKVPIHPSQDALAFSRDRLTEKNLFRELGISTPEYAAVDSLDDLREAVSKIGLPAVLKTRTLGYDGKGQVVLHSPEEVEPAWNQLKSVPCILESFVPFTREISVIAARSVTGETAYYPVSENTHRSGILHLSVNKPGDEMQKKAEDYIRKLLDRLDYAGVLALELFDADGTLLANEMAPRVHNTGHLTIEGSQTSQFENHLRAVLGLPLGSTSARGFSAMVNFIGEIPEAASVLKIRNAHFHNYGKKPRKGRKVGHATVCADNSEDLYEILSHILELVQ
ncbi:MAG: 5-(carboxyamino)imidazole ribonucleotide synthase [Chitinispirillaceae bacterium]